jgi:hypothetical protein
MDIIGCTITNWKERSKNSDDWEKPIKEAKSALNSNAIEGEEEETGQWLIGRPFAYVISF